MDNRPTCPVCTHQGTRSFTSIWPVTLRACNSCQVRFVWPIPTDDELRRRYEREHHSGKWAELVDQGDPLEPRRRAALLTRFATSNRRRVLDVGFGDGRFLDAACEMGWTALGLEIAREAASSVAHRHRVAVGLLGAIRPGGSVDAVTFWDVLEHVPHPAELLAAAYTCLQVDGLIAVTMPSASSVTARIEGDRWRYYDLGTYGHLVHMTPQHLRVLFDRAGFEVVHVETRGSVDLRHSLRSGRSGLGRAAVATLDKISGLVARIAVPLGWGNTVLIVGRKPASPPVKRGSP